MLMPDTRDSYAFGRWSTLILAGLSLLPAVHAANLPAYTVDSLEVQGVSAVHGRLAGLEAFFPPDEAPQAGLHLEGNVTVEYDILWDNYNVQISEDESIGASAFI